MITKQGKQEDIGRVRPYYQDGSVTLYHGDCLDIMPLLDLKVDMILCDLPYG